MLRRIRFGTMGLIAAAALGSIGCDGNTAATPAAIKEQSIKQVGDVYRNFIRDNHKPPTSVKDFNRYAQMAPAGCKAIRDGAVEVYWGVNLSDLSDAPSSDSAEEVLAFEKQVPTEGGTVLLKNRSVRAMTPDEFKAAPKAGTVTSAATPAGKKK